MNMRASPTLNFAGKSGCKCRHWRHPKFFEAEKIFDYAEPKFNCKEV